MRSFYLSKIMVLVLVTIINPHHMSQSLKLNLVPRTQIFGQFGPPKKRLNFEIAPLLSGILIDYMHRWDIDQDSTLTE